ncbi:MAG: hypothetical protein U5J83_13715 [Bryobacterales bacterium]|nr:hypothetical protein [Bryobacterales bacterium]
MTGPVAGYLYFASDIDLEKIRKLELLFAPDGPDGNKVVLRMK